MNEFSSKNQISKLIELHRLELEAQKYSNCKDPYKQIEIFQKILEYRRLLKNISGQVRTLNQIGKLYYKIGESQKGWEYHSNLIDLVDNLSGSMIKLHAYNDLLHFYQNIGNNDVVDLLNSRLRNL